MKHFFAATFFLANTAILYAEGPFAKPVKLKADGHVIDIGPNESYTGALIGDFNQDGVDDLAVTSVSGSFRIYRNKNRENEGDPVYADLNDVLKRQIPPKLNNW